MNDDERHLHLLKENGIIGILFKELAVENYSYNVNFYLCRSWKEIIKLIMDIKDDKKNIGEEHI